MELLLPCSPLTTDNPPFVCSLLHSHPFLALHDVCILTCIHVSIAPTVDECANDELNNCDDNALCADTPEGFTCNCTLGYIGDGVSCSACPPNTHGTYHQEGTTDCTPCQLGRYSTKLSLSAQPDHCLQCDGVDGVDVSVEATVERCTACTGRCAEIGKQA